LLQGINDVVVYKSSSLILFPLITLNDVVVYKSSSLILFPPQSLNDVVVYLSSTFINYYIVYTLDLIFNFVICSWLS